METASPVLAHSRPTVVADFFVDLQSLGRTALADIRDRRTLFVSASGLQNAKRLVTSYKKGEAKTMTPEIWQAKKVVDSTLHPGMEERDMANTDKG